MKLVNDVDFTFVLKLCVEEGLKPLLKTSVRLGTASFFLSKNITVMHLVNSFYAVQKLITCS